MPHPEGYRKALRHMKQAEKFNRPIICFIDTKGAYPGKANDGSVKLFRSEAIVAGIALYKDLPVTIIGHQRGKKTKENVRRNFGMPHPEGYRKALRHMKQAEKFNRPIICFIDTKGAYPGKANDGSVKLF